ncbi:MAG TPA: hypothetical protein VFB28_06630, partial [Terriglobales bacterium]|nr:hypothetical protein [Terriglobales bacterium]
PAPPPHFYTRGDESTVLFYNALPQLEPDWLGEIFEWVSCADEYSIEKRDRVGRVPFEASYIGRHHLDPLRPYAAIAMRLLQYAITNLCSDACRNSSSPLKFAPHVVVNTHDVDFLPDGRMHSAKRLAKNAVISLLLNKTAGAGVQQLKSAIAVAAGGADPFDQVIGLADRENRNKVSSSFYFLCDHHHRRDSNYRVENQSTQALMHVLHRNMEVGVHGSYCSADQPAMLADEFAILRRLGFHPLGGRQHWLRFTIPALIRAVEDAGAAYDCSIGWPYTPGFRAGACFAFPPYDWEREHAAPFLEIPLVLMDQAMMPSSDGSALDRARELLAASRHYGWGGISLLWHPTAFGGGQFPEEIGDCFWTLMKESLRQNDAWMSAGSFVKHVWERYCEAGLLPQRQFA